MTNMEKVAEMLGVKIGEKFNIEGDDYNPHKITINGLVDADGDLAGGELGELLTGVLTLEKINQEPMQKSDLETLIERIAEHTKTATMLVDFQLGIALRVIQDKIDDINPELAQRCNDLQHEILGDK